MVRTRVSSNLAYRPKRQCYCLSLTLPGSEGCYWHELFLRGKQFLAYVVVGPGSLSFNLFSQYPAKSISCFALLRKQIKNVKDKRQDRRRSSPDTEPNFYSMPVVRDGADSIHHITQRVNQPHAPGLTTGASILPSAPGIDSSSQGFNFCSSSVHAMYPSGETESDRVPDHTTYVNAFPSAPAVSHLLGKGTRQLQEIVRPPWIHGGIGAMPTVSEASAASSMRLVPSAVYRPSLMDPNHLGLYCVPGRGGVPGAHLRGHSEWRHSAVPYNHGLPHFSVTNAIGGYGERTHLVAFPPSGSSLPTLPAPYRPGQAYWVDPSACVASPGHDGAVVLVPVGMCPLGTGPPGAALSPQHMSPTMFPLASVLTDRVSGATNNAQNLQQQDPHSLSRVQHLDGSGA